MNSFKSTGQEMFLSCNEDVGILKDLTGRLALFQQNRHITLPCDTLQYVFLV